MEAFIMTMIVCSAAFIVFPRGFKYLVGIAIGFLGGGFMWSLLAMACHSLITCTAFVMFAVAGIVGGCVLAARG